ncbi:MAG TPA: DUF2516 family protein [Mycobacteriales bacterium]|nr:DUF2516 family protein [Mycobacteriales bacterium]
MDSLTELLLRAVYVGVLIVEAWAVVDCVRRPTASYVAAGKLTKPAWLAITVLALATSLLHLSIFNLFGLAGIIAAVVYLVDVRPAIKEVQGGGDRW